VTAEAAEFAHRADERLREFMSSAGVVVLASHGDDLLRSQCDTAVWLDQGRVRQQGELDKVLAEYHASYAGPTAAAITPSLKGMYSHGST
jgi:ABC-type polysaccharide/polyol phosphate transport system ATPase subunit